MDETTTLGVHDVPEGVEVPQVPGYRVTRWVGQGGSAHVWRARRVEDDELVALKVLDVSATEAAVREYTVLAETAVEHIVRVHDCVTTEGDGRTVLVLDWMAGGSLADVIRARGFLSAGEVVTIVSPLATALGRLHRLGVVHGDVSAGNVLLDSTGRPAWSDLGCSRLVGLDPADRDPWGTDGFVAPEVAVGRAPHPAGDVYGLGAIAWACLTGAAPGHRAVRKPLREITAGVPDALVRLVERCLDPDPVRRPDVDDLAREIFEAARAEPLTIVVPDDISSTMTRRIRDAAARDESEVPFWEREVPEEEAPRRWWPWRREPDIDLTSDPAPSDAPALDGPTRPRRRLAERETRAGAHGAGVDRSGLRPWLQGAAVLAAGLLLTTLVPWDRLAAADPAGPPSPVAAAPASPAAPAPAVVPESEERPVLLDPDAARERPAELMTALADARALVLVEQDREGLREITVEGSPAAVADAKLLGELEEGGYRYAGLSYQVSSVGQARTTAGEPIVLRGRIGTGAYTVLDEGAGTQEQHPKGDAEMVDVRVAWTDGRWRIAEISAPS